jgi:hypothetical protein
MAHAVKLKNSQHSYNREITVFLPVKTPVIFQKPKTITRKPHTLYLTA